MCGCNWFCRIGILRNPWIHILDLTLFREIESDMMPHLQDGTYGYLNQDLCVIFFFGFYVSDLFPYKTKYSSHGFCLVVSGGAVAYTFPEECWEGIEEEKGTCLPSLRSSAAKIYEYYYYYTTVI